MTVEHLQTQAPPQGRVIGKLCNALVDDGDPRPLWRHVHVARIGIPDGYRHEQELYAAMLQAVADRLTALDPNGRHRAVSDWLAAEAHRAN